MYVDAKLINGKIYVSDKSNGGLEIKTFSPPYVYYYVDDAGRYTSIYGDKLKKKQFTNYRDFQNSLQQAQIHGKNIFESDIDPVFRLLEEEYPSDDTPKLNVSFLDIEVDKDPSRGFARTDNPYAIINAITIYNDWEDTYYTLLVAPPNLSKDEARALLDIDNDDGFGELTEDRGFYLCDNEAELLMLTIEIIQGADVLTGWNSAFFDMPYIIQRIRIVLGGEDIDTLNDERGTEDAPYDPSEASKDWLLRLCAFPILPRMRMVERYGGLEKVYDIYGRIHLDYMELYQKFTFEELHSYSLDFILNKEVDQQKVQYDGSLDELYRNDFRRFTAYNKQDVAGMVALDKKIKMIELANQMSHMASVTFDKVLGSVAIIEQAILKNLHKDGYICFNKQEHEGGTTIPGAFVYDPEGGLYDWIVSYDFNSLYPTIIRMVNISPEVLVGQFVLEKTEEEFEKWFDFYGGNRVGAPVAVSRKASTQAWSHFTGTLEYHMIIDETDDELTLQIEGEEESITLPAKEWKQILKDNNWSISGNATVFNLNREGIVSKCLTTWYNERVEYQKKAKEYNKKQTKETDPVKLKEYKNLEAYYDMVQLVKKIFLNSTYGAFLSPYFLFYDPRLGKSVTLTGRILTKMLLKETEDLLNG